MTYDRAIEILDPTHREDYGSIDPVNEACRMGMEALQFVRDFVFCKDCSHCSIFEDGKSFSCNYNENDYYAPYYDAATYFCGDRVRKGQT